MGEGRTGDSERRPDRDTASSHGSTASMDHDRWQRLKSVLDAAMELADEQRTDFLDRECDGDPLLREEVEALLAAHRKAGGFLEPSDSKVPPVETRRLAPGDHVGPYRVLQEIGVGGMGEVYEAQQEEPVNRRVAIKIVKLGMDTREVLSRFESERQALALMDHPSIARVLDAGTTENGQPFFVMEYVKGIPITEYCDTERLDVRQRIELFQRVCEGIQHAHQKGIIHRDIKPSNVLITMLDDRPVPKIIDFGVAKATAHPLAGRTLLTRLGQPVGTPEYMSPEQAERSALDVDTRADVYSLGVLLYRLLTGHLPFDWKKHRNRSFEEIRRILRDEEPPAPSARLRRLGDGLKRVAEQRRTDPPSLLRELEGDLDWIALKAMEKDRVRRYASVSELAADLGRHLRHEPVSAGPRTSLYRLGKFIRRHKVGVVAAALVLAALAFGVTGTFSGLLRARRAEATARQEASRANQEAEAARQVADFMVHLFEVSSPDEARGNTITAREILDRGSEEIFQSLQDQPMAQARLMNAMGKVYKNLGLYPEAETLLSRALSTREEQLGEQHVDVAESAFELGLLRRTTGKMPEAESLLRRSLDIREAVLEPDDPRIISSLNSLTVVLAIRGQHSEAEPLFERVVAANEKRLGPEHPQVARNLVNLANIRALLGRYASAEQLLMRSLATSEKQLGPDHPDVATVLTNLAEMRQLQDQHRDVVQLYERALAIRRDTVGERHPYFASIVTSIAVAYSRQGRYEEAEEAFERARSILESTVGEEHRFYAENRHGYANLLRDRGQFDQAEPIYREAIEIRQRVLAPDHPGVEAALDDYAELLRRDGRDAEAAAVAPVSATGS